MGALCLVATTIAESDSRLEGKSDADAKAYYATYGYWPSWYTGAYTYPYTYGYGHYGHYLGKRSSDSEAITKADSDAYYYYTTHGTWPVGYTGYYNTYPYTAYTYGHYLGKEVLILKLSVMLILKPSITTTPMVTGQQDILVTTIHTLMDMGHITLEK